MKTGWCDLHSHLEIKRVIGDEGEERLLNKLGRLHHRRGDKEIANQLYQTLCGCGTAWIALPTDPRGSVGTTGWSHPTEGLTVVDGFKL